MSSVLVRQRADGTVKEGGNDDDEPARPQKKFYRTRAHSNVLNANDFWYPSSPEAVPVQEYFPALIGPSSGNANPQIKFVDIGCGYGSLLLELTKIFPSSLMLGIEIRPKVVEYVQRKVRNTVDMYPAQTALQHQDCT